MENIINNLKKFNWHLFFSLCLLSLIPFIYQTISTTIISIVSSSEGIDILGQMEWFDLIDETIKAFLIIPLYSILNKIFKNNINSFANNIFKYGLIVFSLYFLFNIFVFIYGKYLISIMNPKDIDINSINTYLILETIAFIIGIIPSFINVVFVVIGKAKNIYLFLILKVILGILLDLLFIPHFKVNGVAISNIIENTILSIVCILILYFKKLITFSLFNKDNTHYFKDYLKIGFFSGTQQFIDNFVYAIMISKMVNMVYEQGNYWVANNFIWGFLLIPILALSEVIKSDCKENYNSIRKSNYYIVILFTCILWLLTIPTWKIFFKDIQKIENYNKVLQITFKLIPFYIAYGLCIIPDSLFIGKGKIFLNAINSLLVNFVYYGVWFILYKINLISFTIDIIILMFGFGMVFHLIISFIEQLIFNKQCIKKASNNLNA